MRHPDRTHEALPTLDGLAPIPAFGIPCLVVRRDCFINTKYFWPTPLDDSLSHAGNGRIDIHSRACGVCLGDFPNVEVEKDGVLRVCGSNSRIGCAKYPAAFSNRPISGSIDQRGNSAWLASKGRSERLAGND